MKFFKIKDLSFGYKNCPAIFNKFCCEVNDAKFIHINGISGSGKTTFFKIICGFINASYEELIISGNRIPTKTRPYDRNIAMVFQRTSLWQHLNVNKNIKLAWDKKLIPKKVLDLWINKLEINKLKSKKCSELSAGEQQRIEVFRALSSGKKILLLDEPFAFQDITNQKKLIEAIEFFREMRQGLVLFSTHSTDAKEYFSSQSTICI